MTEEPDGCKPNAGLTSRGVWLASRLPSARCQTSFIPLKLTQDGIPPTMISEDGTAVSSCPPEWWEVPPVNPVHVLYQIWGGPREWTSALRILWVFYYLYNGLRWQQNLDNSFIYVRVYYLATGEWSEFLPGSSLSPLAPMQQQTMTFHLSLAVVLWQLHKYKWNSCLAQLHLRGRGWTNSPPLFNNWDDAGQPPSPTWSHLGHLFAGIAMSSWRSTERYEDFLFWKRSVSLSFLDVFPGCVVLGCFCVWVCFVSTLEDTWLFAFHLFSNNVRIADRRQDVLMTVS